MSRSDKMVSWIPPIIGYFVWFVVIIVVRSVVMSLRGVQELGYCIWPFRTAAYPMGLLWSQVIDVVFLTIIFVSILAFSKRVRDLLKSVVLKLPELGDVAYFSGVIGAVVFAYLAYDDLIMPPLASQRVDWVYKVLFGVIVAGVSALAIYELTRMLLRVKKESIVIASPGAVSPSEHTEMHLTRCQVCGNPVGPGDRYCSHCGARINEQQEAEPDKKS